MSKLEQFIKDNKDGFDSEKPSPEVWRNIQSHQNDKKVKMLDWWYYAKRVAAVVVIAGVSILLYEQLRSQEKMVAEIKAIQVDSVKTTNAEYEFPTEFKEAAVYYSMEIDEKMEEIETYSSEYPEIKKDIEYDIAELDQAFKDLKKDLNENVANEEILEAMIENYRLKVEILEDLLLELKELENQSDEDDEENI